MRVPHGLLTHSHGWLLLSEAGCGHPGCLLIQFQDEAISNTVDKVFCLNKGTNLMGFSLSVCCL